MKLLLGKANYSKAIYNSSSEEHKAFVNEFNIEVI